MGNLVIGTGRCGTKAFARFAYELGYPTSHETSLKFRFDDWFDQPDEVLTDIQRFLDKGGVLVGYPYLAIVPKVKARVICLHRPKDAFIQSASRSWNDPKGCKRVHPTLNTFGNKRREGYDWWWRFYEEEMYKIPRAIHMHGHWTKERVKRILL